MRELCPYSVGWSIVKYLKLPISHRPLLSPSKVSKNNLKTLRVDQRFKSSWTRKQKLRILSMSSKPNTKNSSSLITMIMWNSGMERIWMKLQTSTWESHYWFRFT
jgi:hypothetical protein